MELTNYLLVAVSQHCKYHQLLELKHFLET
jgi:hypothetical protein